MRKLLFAATMCAACGLFAGEDGDSFAFYAFKEAVPGTDATTVTLVNAIDASKHPGTVTTFATADTESAATFSDDAPGKYVYSSSLPDAELICDHPQSIYLSAMQNNKGCGGTISLADVATEFSKHHDTGYTVEFYFKAVEGTDPYYSWTTTLQLNGGYLMKSSGKTTAFYVYAPCAAINSMRYGFGGYDNANPCSSAGDRSMPKIHDGQWHRLALVETAPDASTGARRLEFYIDESRYVNVTVPEDKIEFVELANSVAYTLGLNRLCGKYACVRATARALAKEEFMVVAGQAKRTIDEETVSFYPFNEGAPGASAVGVPICDTVNPQSRQGKVTLSAVEGASVTFDDDAPGPVIYSGRGDDARVICDNPGSLYFTAADKGSGTVTFGGLATEISRHHATGFTVEFFIKLDDDDMWKGYAQCLGFNAGFRFNGAAATYHLYLPFDRAYPNTFRWGFSYVGLGMVSQSISESLWNASWHHVALVEETVPGESGSSTTTLRMYLDYASKGSLVSDAPVTLTDVKDLLLCGEAHHGRYSCLRVTKRALDADGFMRAGRARGSASADAVAFYPFTDGTPGSSAVGVPICDAVNPQRNQGKVTLSSDASSSVTFDADAPARYVFSGDRYGATAFCTNPASLHFTSEVTGKSGTVTFRGLGTEVSKYHANGHTIEYFLKLDDDRCDGYSSSFTVNGGYLHNGTDYPFQLFMPMSVSDYGNLQFRYALSTYDTKKTFPKTSASTDAALWGNGWHHVALVETNEVTAATADSPAVTNTVLRMYVDYSAKSSITIGGTVTLATLKDVSLCNGIHHGKYTCLRVTNRALGVREFMYASDIETYWPTTAIRWTFDGPDGASVGSTLTNIEPSFATVNTNLYVAIAGTSRSFSGNGSMNGGVYSERLTSRRRLVDDGYGDEPRTNAGCARAMSTTTGETGFRGGPFAAVALRRTQGFNEGDFTAEGFFRFAQKDWLDTAGTFARGRPRLTLMSRRIEGDSVKIPWYVQLSGVTSAKYSLAIKAYDTAKAELASASTGQGDFLNDGKWHHVAVTYSDTDWRFVLYYDYAPVATNQLSAPLYGVDASVLCLGNGTSINDNTFHGWYDEFRYTRELLGPESFIRLDGEPVGLLMLVR